jgi:hypothetical protein
MFKQKKQFRWYEWLLIAVLTAFTAHAHAGDSIGIISGQVLDTNGLPIAGVTVSTKGAANVITNPGGVFTLAGVKQKSNILVGFAKNGYVTGQGIANLVSGSKEGNIKLPNTLLYKVLLKEGIKKPLNTATGGALSENGSKVIFPPNSLTVAGTVDVAVTSIDVSTNQIQGSPDGPTARTVGGLATQVRSFSMADFSLAQNGQNVNLKKGATATIELLLPANTVLAVGAVKPMWYFDTANGLWQEEGTGTVVVSTTTPGRLAAIATVKHFTWWSFADSVVLTAISGRILNDFGQPIAYSTVSVTAAGVGVAGASADANGVYCIEAPVNSEIRLRAYSANNQGAVAINEWTMFTGSTPATCPAAVQQAPNITQIFNLFCITGVVSDASSLPVSAATVISTSGSFAVTDSNGGYRLDVVARSLKVYVNILGYNTIAVTPPASSGGQCMTLNFNPSPFTACLSGVAIPTSCGFSPTYTVTLNDSSGNVIGSASPTDNGVQGSYCFDGLPADTQLGTILPNQNIVQWVSPFGGSFTGTTGAAGRSCSSNNCAVGPTIQYDCPT